MTETPSTNPFSAILIPVLIYISGRLLESLLRYLYSKWADEISFKHQIIEDSGILTIKSNSDVFIDEMIIHLQDRPFEVLNDLKMKLKLEEDDRIQLKAQDKIRFEFLIQEGADKIIIVNAFMGTKSVTFVENIDTGHNSPRGFMQSTEISIETPRKRYERPLLNDRFIE